MSQAVTEISYIPLKPGTDFEKGDDKTTFDNVIATITKQKGVTTVYGGRQVEDQDVLQVIVGWENLAAHQEFTKTPEFGPFLQQLGSLMGGAPTQFHAKLPETPSLPPNPFQAPVTECLNGYFASDQDEDVWLKESWGGSMALAKEQKGVVKWLGMTGGWSVEPATHENLGEGVEGRLFAGFVGWPSVEEHYGFRGSELHTKVIAPLKTGIKGMKVHHVAFKQYK